MKLDWKVCLKVGVSAFLLYLGIHYWAPVMAILGKAFGAAAPLLIGCVVSFVVSLAVIKGLMEYVRKHSFSLFGLYRIALGLLVLIYFVVFQVIL